MRTTMRTMRRMTRMMMTTSKAAAMHAAFTDAPPALLCAPSFPDVGLSPVEFQSASEPMIGLLRTSGSPATSEGDEVKNTVTNCSFDTNFMIVPSRFYASLDQGP